MNSIQEKMTEERTEIERELQLAKAYWLQTIYPFIKGRVLRGVEFFVARDAHLLLQAAVTKANEWNGKIIPVAGKPFPPPELISVNVDLSAESFREPKMPGMLFAENIKPEILAAIAAPMIKDGKEKAPDEAIHCAHELLMAAERYIGTLPVKEGATNQQSAEFTGAFGRVLFTEIMLSNKQDSRQLPLLPSLQGYSKTGDTSLELKQIKGEVKKILQNNTRLTNGEEIDVEEYSDGDWLPDWFGYKTLETVVKNNLKTGQISVQDLCVLRWNRFKQFMQMQRVRAVTREANKKAAARKKLRRRTAEKRKQ